MTLGGLIGAIDELVATDPGALAGPEAIVELHRQLDRLEALTTRAAGRFDAGRQWQGDGARTAAYWISTRCHRPKGAAQREIGLARGLRHLPACESAWVAGDISGAHVGVLCGARSPATEERLAQDEAMLVGQAKGLRFHQFVRMVDYWAAHADPEGADDGFEGKRQARKFHLSQSFGGAWFANGVLDPVAGSVLATELARIEKAFFDSDWAQAKAALGRDPLASDLARTPGQRRADALVEMAVRSRTAPAGGRGPEPLFTVLVGWETLAGKICELSDGTVIAPGESAPSTGSSSPCSSTRSVISVDPTSTPPTAARTYRSTSRRWPSRRGLPACRAATRY